MTDQTERLQREVALVQLFRILTNEAVRNTVLTITNKQTPHEKFYITLDTKHIYIIN